MCCAAATTRRPCFFFAGVKTPLHEILIKFLSCVRTLRARQEIRCAFWRERRAGRCEAPRRRRCRCASSRSGNKADARPPPRPSGLRPAGPLAVLLAPYIPQRVCSSLAPCQRAWGPAAKCTPYFLTGPKLPPLLRSGTGHGRDGHDTKIHRAELTWRYEIAPWRLMRNLYWNTIGNLPGMHNEHYQGILLDSQ